MSNSESARTALYQEINQILEGSRDEHVVTRAEIVRDLSLAYRYLYGGSQPGSVQVSKD